MKDCVAAKHLRLTSPIGLLAAFLLAGCLSPSPTATELAPTATEPPTATEFPTATEPPTATELVPVVEVTCMPDLCIDELWLELIGTLPDEYTVTVSCPGWTDWQVHCPDGGAQDRGLAECWRTADGSSSRVSFYEFTPETVTVTLAWDGNEISQVFEPEYESHQEKGHCDPCRSAEIVLNVPESP